MPWKESHRMDERVHFISKLIEGDTMSEVCKEFGISRKTGYKFWQRYLSEGLQGIADKSHATYSCPHKTDESIEKLVVALRKIKPSWGPKKLKARLSENNPGVNLPAVSTIGDILDRYGLVESRRRVRKRVYYPTNLRETAKSNEVWGVDFKGQFRLGNGKYCYPLTVTDHFSRYLISCEGFESINTNSVMAAFRRAFHEYGLPEAIRSDNGAPFAARGLLGLSRLSVWWLKLGIKLERIEPGKPQQNGRHERFHLTLKKETTRPAKKGLLQQQECFEAFKKEYNEVRPHEALEQKTPNQIHVFSSRNYDPIEPPVEYPHHDAVHSVSESGKITFLKKSIYVSSALRHEKVGLREIKPDNWLVSFMDYELGYVDFKTLKVREEPPLPV